MVLFFTTCFPEGIVCMGVLPWWAVWLCRGTAEHSCLAHPAISAARCLGPGRSRCTPVPWAWDLCLKAFRFIRRTDEVCLLIYGWEASFCTLSALPLRTWMLLWLRHTCAFQCRQCLHGVKSGDSAQFLKEKNYLFVLAAFFSNHFKPRSLWAVSEGSSPGPTLPATLRVAAHRFPHRAGHSGGWYKSSATPSFSSTHALPWHFLLL